MKLKAFIFFIIFCWGHVSTAYGGVSGIGGHLGTFISQLPQSDFKNALTKYLETVGLKRYSDTNAVGQANFGIRGYFEKKFGEDECFARTAFEFYREIRKIDSNLRRPTLMDKAGEGDYRQHKLGWVFDLALKYSGGDNNKAIELIGLCGHDDAVQGEYKNPKVEQEYLDKGVGEDELFNWDEMYDGYKLCPPKTSDFYLQGSLGKETLLDSAVADKVLTKQSESGTKIIPGKYYHVMASSFLSCQLIEAGMNKNLALTIQVALAEQYRGIRLCTSIEKDYSTYQQLLSDGAMEELIGSNEKDKILINKLQSLVRSTKCDPNHYDSEELCPILSMATDNMSFNSNRSSQQLEVLDKKIERFVYRAVAAGLYHKWFLNFKVSGVGQCTKVPLVTLPMFANRILRSFDFDAQVCGRRLSSKGCSRAIQEIESWLVDFDWTASQHAIGAQFAAKHCVKKQYAGISRWCAP